MTGDAGAGKSSILRLATTNIGARAGLALVSIDAALILGDPVAGA